MRNIASRLDNAFASGVLMVGESGGGKALRREYYEMCVKLVRPLVIVRRLSARYSQITVELHPSDHVMTESTFDAIWELLSTNIVRTHMRTDTTIMAGSGSGIVAFRVPTDSAGMLASEIFRAIQAQGAATVDMSMSGIVARRMGIPWEDIHSGEDYRSAMREVQV